MTPQELQILQQMTQREVIRKYSPLLASKKITSKQFEWLISQGKKETPLEVVQKHLDSEAVDVTDLYPPIPNFKV